MKKTIITLSVISITTLLTISCNNKEDKKNTQKHSTTNSKKINKLVKKPESWIKERIEKAQKKLNSTEGGKLVWQSMEAHGGLEKWFNQGALSFRFDYLPLKGPERKTISQLDVWSNKTVHQAVDDSEDTFGWNGENSWLKRNDTLQFPFDVKFWALTPFYFLGQPFIFDGEGVKIEKLEDLSFENKLYDAVKISYEPGTGDAPDDYYINLYDKSTHLLKVLKYIVSYPKYFKDGGHSPEKTMVLYDMKTINGIQLPTRYEAYIIQEGDSILGDKVTDIEVSQITFLPKLENSHFNIPKGAEIIKE